MPLAIAATAAFSTALLWWRRIRSAAFMARGPGFPIHVATRAIPVSLKDCGAVRSAAAAASATFALWRLWAFAREVPRLAAVVAVAPAAATSTATSAAASASRTAAAAPPTASHHSFFYLSSIFYSTRTSAPDGAVVLRVCVLVRTRYRVKNAWPIGAVASVSCAWSCA